MGRVSAKAQRQECDGIPKEQQKGYSDGSGMGKGNT